MVRNTKLTKINKKVTPLVIEIKIEKHKDLSGKNPRNRKGTKTQKAKYRNVKKNKPKIHKHVGKRQEHAKNPQRLDLFCRTKKSKKTKIQNNRTQRQPQKDRTFLDEQSHKSHKKGNTCSQRSNLSG